MMFSMMPPLLNEVQAVTLQLPVLPINLVDCCSRGPTFQVHVHPPGHPLATSAKPPQPAAQPNKPHGDKDRSVSRETSLNTSDTNLL